MANEAEESASLIADLTARQREVLDLLLQHKTSKEIARELGISPHTVEQRIRFAKEKLDVHRRSDLATAYRRHRMICDEVVYEESRIDRPAIPLPRDVRPIEPFDLIDRNPPSSLRQDSTGTVLEVQLVPAIFEGPSGTLMRVGAVFAIAAATIIVGIGGLAVMEQLSRILS
jgi:DNA-binding CsgD family transcriptional regulator